MEEITRERYQGIVISPGPETPAKAGNLMKVLAYYEKKLPILGICLGHQAIGEYYGAALEKALKPMHGKVSSIHFSADYLFTGIAMPFNIVRYHSLILNNLPAALQSIAETPAGELMALRHQYLPIRGLQFHPEAHLTQFGLQILRNWVNFNKIID